MKKILILLVLLFPLVLLAQPGDDGNPGGDPDKVPLTGVEWLLVSGGILGARKMYQNFKKTK